MLTRAIDVVAYASDASLYRLVPRAVVQPNSEDEVRALIAFATREKIPLTFRTAGTSLSGQAVTDGLLIDLSKHWHRLDVLDGGARVRVQPGLIGGRVNGVLAKYGRRIGPDPASIDTCMIGGILANNSSGMCCGTRENAYQTLDSMRFMLASGLVVDTSHADAGEVLRTGAPEIARGLMALKARVEADAELCARIRAKYRIKNTMGYALNAFLDHHTPEQILSHLIVGSEGTLAFISEAVLRTLPDYPYKRTGLLYFADAARAFAAVAPFEASGARAIEFMDDACLRALPDQPANACALLVEYQAETAEQLAEFRRAEVVVAASIETLRAIEFSEDAAERARLWKLRKGLLPAAGATKRSGETVIIEDIAVPLPHLPQATAELRELLTEYGYDRALIFGHAKDGNCHFALTQSFNERSEIDRYDRFMVALAETIIAHEGSLKAEHGTGRNMAPFVEAEWGREAYAIMRELKALIDPAGVLNPGVILNADPRAHVTHLKDLPTVEEEIDRCIECGFCEPVCPSRRLTLTPRQRIVVRRELARLRGAGDSAELHRDFEYAGIDTCAADGMCSTACPVKIDTGSLVKRLRAGSLGVGARRVARFAATHAPWVERGARLMLRVAHGVAGVVGDRAVAALGRWAESVLGVRLPKWSRAIPLVPRGRLRSTKSRDGLRAREGSSDGMPSREGSSDGMPSREGSSDGMPSREGSSERQANSAIVFIPSCSARIMGLPRSESLSSAEVFLILAERAGVGVFVPKDLAGSCCGLAWGSKGFVDEHELMAERLIEKLLTWSDGGQLPIVIEGSSCLQSLKTAATQRGLVVLDVLEVARDRLLPNLKINRLDQRVVLHPSCAARKMELAGALQQIAERCAKSVEVPVNLTCCGMAGDRGLIYPELSAAAIFAEGAEIRAARADGYYSNNLTCEIGMSQATGVDYRSILYLLEEASRTRLTAS